MKKLDSLMISFQRELKQIISETILKKETKDSDGNPKVEYTTNKKGYKVMFDKNGNPIEVKMDQKEKYNRAQGAGKSGSKQKKRSKDINLDKLRSLSEEEPEDDEEEVDADDMDDQIDDLEKGTDVDVDGDGSNTEEPEEEPNPDDSIEQGDEVGGDVDPEADEEDDMFDDEEDDSPKSQTIYNDIELAIDEIDVYSFKNAFKIYEKILDYLIDDASIQLVNFVYETIPPMRRKKVSADVFVKQIEDQIDEKRK